MVFHHDAFIRGIIVSVGPRKRYGFVVAENGCTYFVHVASASHYSTKSRQFEDVWKRKWRKRLLVGDAIIFEPPIIHGEKNPQITKFDWADRLKDPYYLPSYCFAMDEPISPGRILVYECEVVDIPRGSSYGFARNIFEGDDSEKVFFHHNNYCELVQASWDEKLRWRTVSGPPRAPDKGDRLLAVVISNSSRDHAEAIWTFA